MGWFSGIVVYVCIWWTVVFCVLPLWVKRDEGGPETTAHGAPEDPKIKQKFIITTIVSAIIWGVVYLLVTYQIIDFRGIAANMSDQDYR